MLGRRRVGDLFNDKTVTGRLTSMAKKSIKGVENVYTQVQRLHLQIALRSCCLQACGTCVMI